MTSEAGGARDARSRGGVRALAVYLDRRMLTITVLGFASGLPLLLTLSTLSYWLARVGVDRTAIGLFALVGLPYSLKFLWAPFFDRGRLPLLTTRLGRRRSWGLLVQCALIASILALGATDPKVEPLRTAICALAVAFCSASQDLVIDAFRIEILAEREQGAGAAAIQLGYRLGMLAAGAGAIALSDFASWPMVFAGMASLVTIGMLAFVLADEPGVDPLASRGSSERAAPQGRRREPLRDVLKRTIAAPFADFLRRRGWVVILAFALFYKLGEAVAGVMANPFYVDLGFSGVEIAGVTKVFGLVATLFGVFAGGAFVARYGILPALLIGGVLQALTNLLFAWQALVGKRLDALVVTIGADNFTGGLGSAAFVAYLSRLCGVSFTATQYALLTSFAAAGRTIFSSGGGWLANELSWPSFFVLTTGLALPGLALLGWIMSDEAARPPRSAG